MGMEWIIGLAVLGMLLVLAEVFVPGGVIGTLGVLLVAGAVVGGFMQNTIFGLELLLGILVLGIALFWLWMKYLPHCPFANRMILGQNAATWHGFDPGMQALVGRTGVAKSHLRPAGIAVIDGRRFDVVTRGDRIDAGAAIQVAEVEGNRVVVALAPTNKP